METALIIIIFQHQHLHWLYHVTGKVGHFEYSYKLSFSSEFATVEFPQARGLVMIPEPAPWLYAPKPQV